MTGYTGYAATKGAIDAITLILARELRGQDITVNAVAPGALAADPTTPSVGTERRTRHIEDHPRYQGSSRFGAMTARYIRRDSRSADGAKRGASAAPPSR